ncbi:MAG: zinc ABC transporter substrate-binding protein [Clostridia bacterium]|nr:zinc ABC transporter substrate-binding protein [Clostridia bacterium]
MKKIFLSLLLAAAVSAPLASCANNRKEEAADKPKIAVSIPPQADFIKNICGDSVEIITVIPAGYSPETYEPAPRDIEKLNEADIYFTIGVPAEQSNILPNVKELEVYDLAEKCAETYPELTLGEERDPHIWLSARRAALMTKLITERLSELCPEMSQTFSAGSSSYTEKITSASAEASEILSSAKNKDFIVFHPAFGYFADEYGLIMTALEEEGKEATASRLAQLADMAETKGITAIFYQQETDGHQARAFAEEIGGKAVPLSPLAEDYTENLIRMAKAIAGADNTE